MSLNLSIEEKRYVKEVLIELNKYKLSSEKIRIIKEQLLEHISASHENGEDSIEQLGNAKSLVKDFLEINGIDVQTTQSQNPKKKSHAILIGLVSLPVIFLLSQLILSLFLTQSFSPQSSIDYNILYRVSEHPWWNWLLVSISLATSLILSVILSIILYKRS